jgi:hypothetical protein
VGHAGEKDRASQEETRKAEEDAVELARQKVAVEREAVDADAMDEAGPARDDEAIIKEADAVEVIAPCTATDGTVVEEVATAEAPSDQAGKGEPRETIGEAMEETSTGVGTLGPQETAARVICLKCIYNF